MTFPFKAPLPCKHSVAPITTRLRCIGELLERRRAKVCTSSENVSVIARVRECRSRFSCLLAVSYTHQMVGGREGRFKVADAVKMEDQDGPQSSACGYTGAFCFVSLVRMLVSTPLSFSFPFFCLLHQ